MKKIFFVDDELINRKLFSKLMSDYDVELEMAEDGMTAMPMLLGKQYDLIFMDHMMPKMSGVELLQEIRSIEFNPNAYTPCIALSANTKEGAGDMYLDAGFNAFMKKPLDKAKLVVIMNRFFPPKRNDAKTAEIAAIISEFEANATESAVPIWLIKTTVLEVEEGLRISGSLEEYLEMLRIFKSESARRVEDLKTAFLNNDIRSYQMLTHSLKSAAAIIGAKELADYAEFMERACDNSDEDTIKADHNDFLKVYAKVTDLLNTYVMDVRSIDNKSDDTDNVRLKKMVLIISNKEHISVRAIENHLKQANYKTHVSPPLPMVAEMMDDEPELIVYYTDNYIYESKFFNDYLRDLVVEKGKGLIVVGDVSEYNYLQKEIGENCIADFQELPLDIDAFIKCVDNCFDTYEFRSRLRHRVLVVDDDEMYTAMVKTWLSDIYNVTISNSVVEAIACVERQKPDLILLDYEMPVTDGPQFMEFLKRDEKLSGIPVLFLTGSTDRGRVLKVLDLAPEGYLIKNIDKNALIERIESVFNGNVKKK